MTMDCLAEPALSDENIQKFKDIIDKQMVKLRKKRKIRPHKLSTLLPDEIFRKIKYDDLTNVAPYELDVIEVDYEAQSENDDTKTVDDKVDVVETDSDRTINESTVTDVVELQNNFVPISLEDDPNKFLMPLPSRALPMNWTSKYIKSEKKGRIVWPSKSYSVSSSYKDKTPFERANERMDQASAEFSTWLTSLSKDQCVKMDKELIKELFDIKVKGGAAKALHVEPRQLSTIPENIAAQLNLTEWALEKKAKELAEEELRKKPRKEKMLAFGKLLPLLIRVPKAVVDDVAPLKSDFPEKLRTMEEVFEGLTTLKATKYIVKHLKKSDRPEFVLKCKDFRYL